MHMLSSELICAVLESAPDAMLVVDGSGTIRFANRHVTEVFGFPHDELVGHQVEELVPERFRAAHGVFRDQYMQRRRVRPMGSDLALLGLRADGTEFPVEISLSPVDCEPEVLVVAAIRDITNHLRVENQLKQAREQADRANLAKSRFLATASHDLRQPLQSMSLLAGTLRRLAPSPAALEAVGSLELAIGMMSRLLNALLDVSKLESGKVKPDIRDFPVAILFRELHAEFMEAARSKGLNLIVDSREESAHSDPLLVGQILRNLIANAIRYTKKGTVTLCCRRDGDDVRIEVRDTGIGIPQDQLPYIYDEFYQAGVDTHAAREGYGLGLSIVQRLVKLLQLRIDVTSAVGVGSTFSLAVPRGVAATAAAASTAQRGASQARTAARKQHLLLIEDDAAVLNATRMLLGTEGYRVTGTSSAEEAVQRAAELRDIDVIISDFHLGDGKNGAEAIASIRAMLGALTKAILVTGDTTSAMGEQRLVGPLRLVHKPVTADELLGTLRELLGG
jgi:two-component system, sensor histidine kinase